MTTLRSQTLSSSDYRDKSWPTPGTWSQTEPILVPANLAPVVTQMNKLLALSEGWNSYNAKRIRPLAVETALRFLTDARWGGPLPSVIPTPSGGVQLEWGGDDDGVEFQFGPDGTMRVLVDVNGEMWERVATGLDDPSVGDALRWAEKLA